MQFMEERVQKETGLGAQIVAFFPRILVAILIPAAAFFVLYQGFLFLRDGDAPKWVITVVAIIWGVGGVAVLYWIFNWIVESLSDEWTARLQPFVFVGPALAILTWFLALPAARTFYISLFDRDGPEIGEFVGLANYVAILSDRLMGEAFRNNIIFWMGIATPITVVMGLLIAILADRSKFERVAKSMIFMPMAISFVGAGVIWNFIYEVKPPDVPQIGLLNSIVVALGGEPRAWTAYADIAPWNNIFLVIIVVWLQAGFAMVLFSAALERYPGGDR